MRLKVYCKFIILSLIAFSSTELLASTINEEGHHSKQGQHINLTEGDYDFVFPEHMNEYTAGTKVLQPKDNNIYECRPFPNSGFCIQWSPSANQYEPGVGFAWKEAWVLIKDEER